MRKKTIVIMLIAVFAVLVFKLTITSAQRSDRDSDYARKEELALIEEKIDKVLDMLPEKGSQTHANRDISAKLDQIISNQQKILSELEVVKVRASKK